MKKLLRLFVNLMAVIMLSVACFSLVGCGGDVVKVELQLEIYNYADSTTYDKEDTKLTIELYRHLAPDTVNAIIGYIQDGYYDNAIFYGYESNKIMVGDLKMNDAGDIYQNELMPTVDGEFEAGSVKGSDLKVKEGSIALWRTWYECDSYSITKNQDTGRATWFMPTTELSSYQDYFCVFAVIDLENEANNTTWEYIKTAINDNSESYQVYYTGEYNSDDSVLNNGLTFNCEQEVPDNVTPFAPEGDQFVCYKQHQIKVAMGVNSSSCGAKIVSAKVI